MVVCPRKTYREPSGCRRSAVDKATCVGRRIYSSDNVMSPRSAVLVDYIVRMFGNVDGRRVYVCSAAADPCSVARAVELSRPPEDVGTNNVRRSTHERTRYVSGLSGSGSAVSGSGCSDRRRTTADDVDDDQDDRSSRIGLSDLSRTKKTHTLESIRLDCLYITSMIVDEGCGNCNCHRGRGVGGVKERRGVGGVRIVATVISVILLALLQTTAGE